MLSKLNEPRGKEENVAEANLDPLGNYGKPDGKERQCGQCDGVRDAIPEHDKSKFEKTKCCDKKEDVPLDKRRMSDVNPTQEM